MSCYACGAIIDCGQFGGIQADLAPSTGFFATQDYTFLLDCPPGYLCFPGFWPVVITIPATDIPEIIITDGGNFSIYGCQGLVTAQIPVGISQAQTQAIVNNLFRTWALQEAQCRNITNPGPGIPPPTLIRGRGTRTDLTNSEQCYTAHCVPDSAGEARTFCSEAGAETLTLFDASPDQISAAQAQLNQTALAEAQRQATALLTCGVCNAALHVFQACAGDPSKVVDVDIPAGAYCFPVGSPQAQADAAAQVAAVNQLNALLVGLGCPCPGPTINPATGVVSNVCACQYTWNLNAPTGPFGIGPGSFDPRVQKCNFDGNPILPGTLSILFPFSCPGPSIKFYYTVANTGPC